MNKLLFGQHVDTQTLLVSQRGMNSDDSQVSIRELDKKLEENAQQRKVLVGDDKGYLEPADYNKQQRTDA